MSNSNEKLHTDLETLCGIANAHVTERPQAWVPATLEFLSPAHYVLGTKCVEVQYRASEGGLRLVFKTHVRFQADQLLGKQRGPGVLMDVVVRPENEDIPWLSLAYVRPGEYPRVLRSGEVVVIA